MVCSEAGGEGVPEVVVTGLSRSRGGEEEVSGSGRTAQIVDNMQEESNAPRNDDGTGMKVGIHSSNSTE